MGNRGSIKCKYIATNKHKNITYSFTLLFPFFLSLPYLFHFLSDIPYQHSVMSLSVTCLTRRLREQRHSYECTSVIKTPLAFPPPPSVLDILFFITHTSLVCLYILYMHICFSLHCLFYYEMWCSQDTWISLHDPNVTNPGVGYQWLMRANNTCAPLGVWSNWYQGSPQNKAVSHCVKATWTSTGLQWVTEQCSVTLRVMCVSSAGELEHRWTPTEIVVSVHWQSSISCACACVFF